MYRTNHCETPVVSRPVEALPAADVDTVALDARMTSPPPSPAAGPESGSVAWRAPRYAERSDEVVPARNRQMAASSAEVGRHAVRRLLRRDRDNRATGAAHPWLVSHFILSPLRREASACRET